MTLRIADLLAYAGQQARIESRDYFEPGYARADEVRAWRRDKARRDRDRRRVLLSYPGRIRSNGVLVAGSYGCARRLEITTEFIDYTPGQYAAVEIWPAVLDYFAQTNGAGG